MMDKLYQYPVLTLLVTSVLLFFFNLVELPVSIMEARNFNVAREMLTEGNWFLTTMNGLPRYEKPPFPAWFSTLFGQFNINSVFLYRLPTSIIATLGVVLSYFLFKALSDSKKVALIAGLILGTSFYYIVIRFEAPSDTYTHVFMIGGLLFLVKSMLSENKNILYSLLAILGITISVLSKGPVSLYAVFLPFVIAYGFTYKTSGKNILRILLVMVIGVVLGAIWYFYVRLADPIVFLEITEEETSNWSSYNVRPFYYYWSFFIQSGIWTIPAFLGLLYPYFKNKVQNKKLYLFSWLWTILAVVLLSLIPEKKSRYLVPVLFPLALNTAQILYYTFKAKQLDELSKYFLKFHYLIIFIIGISVVSIPYFIESRSTEFWVWYYIFVALMFAVSGLIFFNFRPLDSKKLFISNILLIAVITSAGTYGIKFLKQNESFRLLDEADLTTNVYYYGSISPEIIWESQTISTAFDPFLEAENKKEMKVIVNSDYLEEFESKINQDFTIISVESYDRNYFKAKDDRKHKDRHETKVYVIKSIK